jgi:hypothetical protein
MHVDLRVWLDHFEYHATRRCAMPERLPDDLTAYERRLIAESVAALQLRERSAGRALLHAARKNGRTPELAALPRIVAFLVAEERHHAALLGAFMDQHGVPRKHRHGAHRALHAMRPLASFELQLAALVSADLIRKVCYRALESATGCQQLQTLCRTLVADELAHVGFESDLLHAIHARKSAIARTIGLMAQRAFFAAASVAAWFTHRKVLRAAGYRMDTFLRACSSQYAFYLEPSVCRDSTVRGQIGRSSLNVIESQ